MSKYTKYEKYGKSSETASQEDVPSLPAGVQTELPEETAADVSVTDNNLDGGENELVIGDASQAPEFITLHNKLRYSETVYSVTGDSVLLPPGKNTVPGHFNWNLPNGISIVKE